MFDLVVVPIDFGHEEVVERVIKTAQANLLAGGRLELIHVLEPIPAYITDQLPPDPLLKREQEAVRNLKTMAAALGLPADTLLKVKTGRPWRVILEQITDPHSQAIVMSGHSPRLSDVVLGSVAAQVVRHAQCSVFVLRSQA